MGVFDDYKKNKSRAKSEKLTRDLLLFLVELEGEILEGDRHRHIEI